MRFHVGFYLFITLVKLTGSVAQSTEAGQPYMSEEKVAVHLAAQNLLLNDQFHKVDSTYLNFILKYPDDPAGYLFRAAGLIAEMSDQEEELYGSLAIRLLDTAAALARATLSESNDVHARAWMHLWLGHVKAYKTIHMAHFGSFLSALKLGLSVKGEYHKALRQDSSLYDAYFGLGSYHYWKSAKAGILGWIKLFKNEKEIGIRELRLSADSSVLSQDASYSGLIWIWLDKKEFDSVVAYSRILRNKYPEGKTFLWSQAKAHFLKKDYAKAVEVYRELRTRLTNEPGNYFNLIEVDYQICMAFEKMSEEEKIPDQAVKIQDYLQFAPVSTQKRQEGKINYLTRMASRADRGAVASESE